MNLSLLQGLQKKTFWMRENKKSSGFSLVEHTADIGIRAFGANYPDLFKNWEFYTFYHEDWDFYNLEEYGVPLSHFFGKPLN